MIMANISQSLRETFPARASEWALATMMANWSVILFMQPGIFGTAKYFSVFADVMQQSTFATLCGIVGFGRLIVLAINGHWRRSPHLRAFSAFITAGVWFVIAFELYKSGAGTTGLGIYPVLMLLDSYNVIRAAGEAGISDHQHPRAAKDGHPG